MKSTESPKLALDSPDELVLDIVGKVAEAEGVGRLDLPPLGSEVNLDSILEFVQYAPDWRRDEPMSISFEYVGHTVRIYNDGRISLPERQS